MIKTYLSYLLAAVCIAHSEPSTNPCRTDGFGAQFQTIISSVLYAEFNHKDFVYTPFIAMEHNYDNSADFLRKKEELINFINYYRLNNNDSLQDQPTTYDCIHFFESNIDWCENSSSLAEIKRLFRLNKSKEQYFSNDAFHIAVHIRRPNAHDSRIQGTETPDGFFLKTIDFLREQYRSNPVLFHIYSQGKIEDFEKIYNGKDIVLHINDSIENTFTSLVLADALVTSTSSLSYCAALLSNGPVYYTPFWHPPFKSWFVLN
jgi:hypothetical protein